MHHRALEPFFCFRRRPLNLCGLVVYARVIAVVPVRRDLFGFCHVTRRVRAYLSSAADSSWQLRMRCVAAGVPVRRSIPPSRREFGPDRSRPLIEGT